MNPLDARLAQQLRHMVSGRNIKSVHLGGERYAHR